MNEIYFAQIREDARVEHAVCERHRPRRIVTIGSGGCVALSLLSDEVDTIYAVDSNPAQCAVIELKRAALVELDREAYLRFIGEGDSPGRAETYRRLARRLPAYARDFWDRHEALLQQGVNHCGVTERFYRYVGGSLRASVAPDAIWHRLLACSALEEQREIHARHFTGEPWTTAIRLLLSKRTHLLFFPEAMFVNATEHDFGDFFARQFDHEVRHKPLASNYFLSQLLFGRYLDERPEGMPRYLDPKRWEEAKRNAGKLEVVPQSIGTFVRETADLDAFFLSNVFDWMQRADRAQFSEAMLSSAAPEACVLFRNMLSTPVLPEALTRRLRLDANWSAELHHLERSMSYQRVTVGTLS